MVSREEVSLPLPSSGSSGSPLVYGYITPVSVSLHLALTLFCSHHFFSSVSCKNTVVGFRTSPVDQTVKNLHANTEDAGYPGSIPESRRSHRERNGNPLQYSCLQNPMDRGAWQAIVYGVAKSQTQLTKHTSTSNPGKLISRFICKNTSNKITFTGSG